MMDADEGWWLLEEALEGMGLRGDMDATPLASG